MVGFSKAHGDYLEAAQFTEDLLQAMGQECDGGNIPKEKFMSALRKQPVLLEAFGKTVVPGMDALQHDFKGLGNSVQGLDLQSLSNVGGMGNQACESWLHLTVACGCPAVGQVHFPG